MSPVQFSLSFGMHLLTGMSGLEVLLMAPYFRLGSALSGFVLAEAKTCTVTEMYAVWSSDGFIHALQQLPTCIGLALAAWLVSGIVLVPILYATARSCLAMQGNRFRHKSE
eukprot:CAMPEP_0184398158 /NCGR_PEP_ID=MMETSP0007-20130409/64380_1 /TAXON_ID=97485 /ORGANISM="Prymnesium parvum, Strain Texoma1" /LENGTH=110 /DNA_ID=CAMNT_0026751959 /DNA_START=74 /DNA_END=406 /DNA_ORIENTATION=-